jgi:hypothetical protein
MRRLTALLALAALAAAASACGSDPEARMRLRTPPVQSSAAPLPEVKAAEERAERAAHAHPSQKDAERMRPVLRAWGDALRHNDYDRASRYFALPAIVAQDQPTTLETAAQVKAFNAALPCGVKLLGVAHEGRFVIGTFKLTLRAAHKCDAPGRRVRVAFAVRGGKIAEWREIPDTPGAKPGPDRPEDAPPPPAEKVA